MNVDYFRICVMCIMSKYFGHNVYGDIELIEC